MPTRWLTSALLVVQFAVALGSLISISAAARAVGDTTGIPESQTKTLMTMLVAAPVERYNTPDRRNDFFDSLRREFESVEGVTRVAFASHLPFGGAATRALVLDGQDAKASGPRPMIRSITITPGYFDTLGVPLIRGRAITEQDGTAEPTPVIVNQRFVELHLTNADPIGAPVTLIIDSVPRRFTIVGVSPTIKQRPGPFVDPVVYFPQRAAAPSIMAIQEMKILVRGSADLTAVASSLRNAVRRFDADIPLYKMMSLDEAIAEIDWNSRFSNMISSVAGLLAVLLAAIGLYAVTAHAVSLMTPEIGIRTALGARPHHVLVGVLRRAAIQLTIGIAAGVAFAFAWGRLFGSASAPSGVGFVDFTIAAAMLALIALVACLVPARRALRVNPIVALRFE